MLRVYLIEDVEEPENREVLSLDRDQAIKRFGQHWLYELDRGVVVRTQDGFYATDLVAYYDRTMFGVYRVTRSGDRYVSRSATHSEKLAREIAEGLSRGEIVMPDGSTKHVPAHPHIHKAIEESQS